MMVAGGSNAYIMESVATKRAELEERCTTNHHLPESLTIQQLGEPANNGGDSFTDSSNLDYFARADAAKQLICGHPVFKGIVNEMPLLISGAQAQLCGVQDC